MKALIKQDKCAIEVDCTRLDRISYCAQAKAIGDTRLHVCCSVYERVAILFAVKDAITDHKIIGWADVEIDDLRLKVGLFSNEDDPGRWWVKSRPEIPLWNNWIKNLNTGVVVYGSPTDIHRDYFMALAAGIASAITHDWSKEHA